MAYDNASPVSAPTSVDNLFSLRQQLRASYDNLTAILNQPQSESTEKNPSEGVISLIGQCNALAEENNNLIARIRGIVGTL